MPTRLAERAKDKSPYYVTVFYKDEDGVAIVPSSATWSLYGRDMATVVNSRKDVAIATPAVSNTIALAGADTAYASGGGQRFLTVTYIYTDGEGVARTAYDHAHFFIDDVAGVV